MFRHTVIYELYQTIARDDAFKKFYWNPIVLFRSPYDNPIFFTNLIKLINGNYMRQIQCRNRFMPSSDICTFKYK